MKMKELERLVDWLNKGVNQPGLYSEFPLPDPVDTRETVSVEFGAARDLADGNYVAAIEIRVSDERGSDSVSFTYQQMREIDRQFWEIRSLVEGWN